MVSSITIFELMKIIDKINIVDIRSVEKFNGNHIPGAKSIPKNELVLNPSKFLDKTKTYYIYCQVGTSSVKTCAYLNKQGYKTINILGGYESWLLERK